MGGMIGFQFGVDQPQMLKSLTIVNSAPEVKVRSRDDFGSGSSAGADARAQPRDHRQGAGQATFSPNPNRLNCGRKFPSAGQKTTNVLISPASDAIVGWGVQERLSRS
jgi:3-oxoadipate enol-lactonase